MFIVDRNCSRPNFFFDRNCLIWLNTFSVETFFFQNISRPIFFRNFSVDTKISRKFRRPYRRKRKQFQPRPCLALDLGRPCLASDGALPPCFAFNVRSVDVRQTYAQWTSDRRPTNLPLRTRRKFYNMYFARASSRSYVVYACASSEDVGCSEEASGRFDDWGRRLARSIAIWLNCSSQNCKISMKSQRIPRNFTQVSFSQNFTAFHEILRLWPWMSKS